jgi:hypothetical protein
MKEILRRSSIKDKFIVFLIIFALSLIIISIIYRYLFYPIYKLEFPYVENITSNGTEIIKYYELNITGSDLLQISLNGILKNEKLNFSDPNESIKFIYFVDNYILNNSIIRANYKLYYEQLSEIYPQYSFIFCLQNSCGAFTFTENGITNIPISYINNMNTTLIIYISSPIANEIEDGLKNENLDIIKIIKDGLKNGNIMVYNTQQVVKNILYLYSIRK